MAANAQVPGIVGGEASLFNPTPPLRSAGPSLNLSRHVTYWKRCLKTYLPPQYTSMDANRMMVAYFTFLSLDLLGALDSTLSDPKERQDCLNWVYLCQHHDGGFRGSPGVDLDGREQLSNEAWDSSSVPATFFALSILAMLRDDFSRLKRKECLTWLKKVQRPGGSFGEHLGENGVVEGGMDTRFGFCAAGIWWLLRGPSSGDNTSVPGIDIDGLVRCIRLAQTFDGGISEMPFHEPHGGYTYCALAALSLIDGLPKESTKMNGDGNAASLATGESKSEKPSGIADVEWTTRWLVSQQTSEGAEDDCESDDENDDHVSNDVLANGGTSSSAHELRYAGFAGRPNKPSDTCYAFWIPGSLSILGKLPLHNATLSRNYLLEKTQHAIGGFGKKTGDPPDIYHSALGLAALALIGEQGLRKVDARVCLSEETVRYIEEGLPWSRKGEGEGPP